MVADQDTATHQAGLLPTATEKAMAELWREVLECAETPRPADDFFGLGGDSIAMVTVLFRIQEEFAIELPPGAIFGSPTLRELSALIDESATPDSDIGLGGSAS